MDSAYEMVCYKPELKGQVIELQRHLWSPGVELNAAYFAWKYERNPYIQTPLIYIAMQNGKAVGMRGFFGTKWEGGIPPEKSIVPYADDLVIAPEHRNRGLIPKIMVPALADLGRRGYLYTFNLSAGPMTLITSLGGGWRNVGSMRPMRQQSWRVTLRRGRDRLVKGLSAPSLENGEITSQQSLKRRWSLTDIDMGSAGRKFADASRIRLEAAPRSAGMAELVERISSDGRIRHVRDREYFDWRFQNPLSRYRFLFWEETRLEGYLVLQEYTSAYANEEVVNIVDWEASSAAIQARLLQAAKILTAHRRLIIWSASLSAPTREVLDSKGFKLERQPKSTARQRSPLLVRPIRDEALADDWLFAGQPLLSMKSWDLRMLYSMHG